MSDNDTLVAPAGLAGPDEGAAQADTAAELEQLQARVTELETENAVLVAENQALQAKLTAADTAPKVKSARAPKPRAIGPLKEEAPSSAELLELIRSADLVEVAFSDGKREIASIPARQVYGDAWAITVAGLALRGVAIELQGLPAAVEISGYGLLLDGDLVAYRPRMEPLRVLPGQRASLEGDIVF